MSLTNRNLGDAMNFAGGAFFAGVPTVQATMPNWVDRLNMVRSAATRNMALMMDVPSRGAIQRFVNETVHFPQFGPYPDMAVSLRTSVTLPNPAITCGVDPTVKAQKFGVSKHSSSIHFSGFNASATTGAVEDESAVAPPCAPDTTPESDR